MSTKVSMKCQLSIDQGSVKGINQGYGKRVSIQGIDQHSVADAFSTHDPRIFQEK